jgi:hypothetical protein
MFKVRPDSPLGSSKMNDVSLYMALDAKSQVHKRLSPSESSSRPMAHKTASTHSVRDCRLTQLTVIGRTMFSEEFRPLLSTTAQFAMRNCSNGLRMPSARASGARRARSSRF